MKVITAPEPYTYDPNTDGMSIFLAGSIEMGELPNNGRKKFLMHLKRHH